MDTVVVPRVEMAMISTTGSSGHGPNRKFQNPDQQDFPGDTENTPLMTASSRTDINNNHSRTEGQKIKNSAYSTR